MPQKNPNPTLHKAWSSGWKLSKNKHPLDTETITDANRGAERKEQGCGRRERDSLHGLSNGCY